MRGRWSEVVRVRCVIPAVGGQISRAPLRVGVRFFTFSLFSLLAGVSRYTVLRLLLGHRPPKHRICAGFSKSICLCVPAPCTHAACAVYYMIFASMHAAHALSSYFCVCEKVILSKFALVITVTSIISRRARCGRPGQISCVLLWAPGCEMLHPSSFLML